MSRLRLVVGTERAAFRRVAVSSTDKDGKVTTEYHYPSLGVTRSTAIGADATALRVLANAVEAGEFPPAGKRTPCTCKAVTTPL